MRILHNSGKFCPFCVKDILGSCNCQSYCNGKKFSGSSRITANLSNGSTEKWNMSWKTTRRLVLLRDNCKCFRCKKKIKQSYETHHIRRREHGGTNHPSNLMSLCDKCHNITKSTLKEKKMMEELNKKQNMGLWKSLKVI